MSEEKEGMMDRVMDKVRGIASDEHIDSIADAVQKIAPDSLDDNIESLAEKAKKAND